MALERCQHRERTEEVHGIYEFNARLLPLCLPLNPTQTLCFFFSLLIAAFWAVHKMPLGRQTTPVSLWWWPVGLATGCWSLCTSAENNLSYFHCSSEKQHGSDAACHNHCLWEAQSMLSDPTYLEWPSVEPRVGYLWPQGTAPGTLLRPRPACCILNVLCISFPGLPNTLSFPEYFSFSVLTVKSYLVCQAYFKPLSSAESYLTNASHRDPLPLNF